MRPTDPSTCNTRPMEPGIYESLVTEAIQQQVQRAAPLQPTITSIDPADQAGVLARHLAQIAERALAGISDPAARVALVNDLVNRMALASDGVVEPVSHLTRLAAPATPGAPAPSSIRPATPLSDAALLTNASGEPNLGAEIRAEIESADEVDLLCAFVKWHGLRLLTPELERLRERGVPLRVITTTYIGGTERRALDKLATDFGADIRVQYDAQRTRVHAKAWLFRRKTGFDTAYIGSSNLTSSAMLDGVEWNVRLSRVGTPALLEKFHATFDTYWNDAEYQAYDPALLEHRDRLDDALATASGRSVGAAAALNLSGLEVRPYPHQLSMLEALAAERQMHDRHRNLVVAATGTGKTVVAALDYRNLCDAAGERPSLLFVAHRKEILEQSLRTYREVLGDGSFGELYVGGARPERWRHVFASVQSLTSYGVQAIPTDSYAIVVIDEFHHAESRTYRAILDHLQPRELLGLTATPERTDGTDVRLFFDGRTAVELRLWDALGADLLCPFHYFAVADGVDLRHVGWSRGRYDEAELSNVYTGNTSRARLVLGQVQEKVLDPLSMRALGFCVSVAHAEFMAQAFTAAGIPARAVSGGTSASEREQALLDLKSRRVNVLFAADLFNEGLDLPDVDTVLFLRPTESATVFLQQLGRGLRGAPHQAVLTVLDFVGRHRTEFRFDHKLRALTGLTRRGVERGVEHGFPFLPSGCQIVMDKESQTAVLHNIRGQVANRWPQIVAELRSYGDHDLPSFLEESGVELSDIVRSDRSWTRLRREAGLSSLTGGARESELLKRVRSMAHVDDPARADAYLRLLRDDSPAYDDLGVIDSRFARMLFFSLWPNGGGHTSFADGLESLRTEEAVRHELRAIITLTLDATRHRTFELKGRLAPLPLQIHARYQREEILSGLDYATLERRPSTFQSGVVYAGDHNVDAFFITLRKSEAAFSPSTMYRDYPISPTLFHWESQSTTSLASPTGQRYIRGSSSVLLFIRHAATNEFGTSPYLFLGPATYVQHSGERPIAVTWRLANPMPADVFNGARVAAG